MRRPALLALPAAAVLALTACGGDTEEDPTPAVGTTFADEDEPDSAAPTETGRASGALISELEFEDQSGDGSSATVARVALTVDGFVAVFPDDADDDSAEGLLGSTAVEAGEATDVEVPLSPALTEDAELEAVLYGDTDEDGEFDPTIDQRIPDTDDPEDDVTEDASYTVQ
ncbi:DUF7282 domain-containing protein [Modestobacter roseus]|uniref:DUF7282 domain-containing protein n=1 Tax=Modestobacter roseus TaxID=1181884 RepID=A0A562IXU5_9ACTN|nr:hypothetical protein [Modestobacter roseus]MQA36216.1 hypothetical protein [Modestobacter roseus]TWH75660.1 hypothetical protein JD78_04224 [Modestobacter roseus]